MKNTILLILISLFSCQTIKKTQQTTQRTIKVNKSNKEMYTNGGKEMPIADIVYKDLIRRKKSEKCAKLLAYANTSLQLLSLRKNNTDFSIYDYGSCRAVKQGDTIQLQFNFSPFGGADRVYFANKIVKLNLHQSTFNMSITHTSDALPAARKVNGKYIFPPFPSSEIKYASLELDQANYAVGDTIKGYLKARSVLIGRNKKETKEILKGAFRAIVEQEGELCK